MKTASEMFDSGEVVKGTIYRSGRCFLKPLGLSYGHKTSFSGHWCWADRPENNNFEDQTGRNCFSVFGSDILVDENHPDYKWASYMFDNKKWISKEDFEKMEDKMTWNDLQPNEIYYCECRRASNLNYLFRLDSRKSTSHCYPT